MAAAANRERSRRSDHTDATRRALVEAGRHLFSRRGYGAVSIEDIVTRARVTRGALYYHFDSKKDLFRAVLEVVEADLVADVQAAMDQVTAAWDLLIVGFGAFLDAATKPAAVQIIAIDGPAVLGWGEWRHIDLRYGLGLVVAALERGMDAGVIRRVPLVPLSQLLLAALTESALQIAGATDKNRTRVEVEGAFIALLEGLRTTRP
ncbi:TetR/AcrR family transcriptional regulator [Mycobacterium spongiae]|uniref:TetR family transcriptional regulator n=1 Tax=Mycobacterium spongiae TaxID=886343 RepID=A0A975JX22_9MYCO|nr:TetR/AcrR family transcriptional regulator [Mycobacterium spongiae]QUR67267.1 TetR family transcriptional regulator [Mycobacterium spongiae]